MDAATVEHGAERELLTAAEVAAQLRIARSTVYELARRGLLPSIVLLRGTTRSVRRWQAADVDAFVARCRQTVQAPCEDS